MKYDFNPESNAHISMNHNQRGLLGEEDEFKIGEPCEEEEETEHKLEEQRVILKHQL